MLQDPGPASSNTPSPALARTGEWLLNRQPLSITLLQGNSCAKHFIVMKFKEVSALFAHRHAHTEEQSSLHWPRGVWGFFKSCYFFQFINKFLFGQ